MGLTRIAITRPVFILMLMCMAFLIGTLSYKSMRIELNPEVNFGVVSITTAYPGAGPDDVNELVSRKIEESVAGVNNVREVTATSLEGVSVVTVQLEIGTDADAALNDVRSKVDAITNELPKDALKPQVTKFDNSAQPILTLGVSAKRLSNRELRDLIDNKLRDRFSQLSGVASASVFGGEVREIQVQVKKDKLLAYGIGILDVQRAVNAGSVNAPSGRVTTNAQEFSVRVKNDYQTAEQVRNMIISINDTTQQGAKSKSVRLSDIATISDTVEERTEYSRLNQADSIVISVQKTREGNAVQITRDVDKTIAGIQQEYASEGIEVIKVFEQAKQIEESLADLNFALFFGIFLVAVIVYVFLHDLRGTIIVAIAIPTSIFATFIALKLAGFTINNLSMLALSLAVGVLVDDAIVVLENIYRHLKMGEDPPVAALNGRAEIGLAALAITFADVVVFTPIGTMGGIVGQFFKPLGLGFVFAVLFSLFVSFTVTPLLAARWYKAGEDVEHAGGRFAKWFERGFERLSSAYGRALEWSLNHRWFVFLTGNVTLFAVFMFIAGSFVPMVAGVGAAAKMGIPLLVVAVVLGVVTAFANLIWGEGFSLKYIVAGLAFGIVFPVAAIMGQGYADWKKEAVFKFGFLPDSDGGQVSSNIELPVGSTLEETLSVAKYVESKMKADPDVKFIVSNVGSQGTGGFGVGASGSNYAQVTATLYDKAAFTDRLTFAKHTEHIRTRSSESVSADLVQAIGRYPGAQIRTSAASGFGFGSAIQLSFTSDDRAKLVKTVSTIREKLAAGAIPGVINPDISSKPGKPELKIVPDPQLLADQGIDAATVGQAVRVAYQGDDTTKLRVNGREYVVRVMLDLNDRNNPDILSQLPIRFNQGSPVYVNSVSTIEQAPGLSRVTRRQRSEEIQVTADLLPGYANGSVNAQIQQWMTKENLVPEGVKFRPLGQADAQARESGYLFGALGIGLVLVYMLLASLYDNLLYPFIIQLAQPQAMVGALLALIITNKSLNIVGMIGIVALVGLVGKNAILLVDYTNTLRERGRNRHDALVEAGPTRLRPIMMTTLALILGMLPVALALGRGSEFRETIGISIIGGITLSTFLTLLVIPCSYTIFDDLSLALARQREAVGSAARWVGRRIRRQPDPKPEPERFHDPVVEQIEELDPPRSPGQS